MKKWFSIVGSLIVIILLGCGMLTFHGHNQRNYGNYIHLGNNDVIDHHYIGAMNYFQGADRVNSNRVKAKKDLLQTQNYVSGNHDLRNKRFGRSVKAYRRSMKINGISALDRRSKIRYEHVKTLMTSSRSFTKFYTQALILNHGGKYKASNSRLDKIINNPQLNQNYFRRFRLNVKRLMTANDKKRWSNVNSGLDINHGQLSHFRLRTPRLITDHPSKVTVNKARQTINRAGVDAQNMSNRDVINLIRQAQKHDSSIYSYAKRNY